MTTNLNFCGSVSGQVSFTLQAFTTVIRASWYPLDRTGGAQSPSERSGENLTFFFPCLKSNHGLPVTVLTEPAFQV
jgi:hypothetical protein